jgi:hypothetical protein
VQDTDIDHEAGTVLDVRDSQYFQQLHPSAVPAELSHYGVTALELMSCVASCGCCVEVSKWSETGDPTVWFEVWWLWFSHHTTIRQLAELTNSEK